MDKLTKRILNMEKKGKDSWDLKNIVSFFNTYRKDILKFVVSNIDNCSNIIMLWEDEKIHISSQGYDGFYIDVFSCNNGIGLMKKNYTKYEKEVLVSMVFEEKDLL